MTKRKGGLFFMKHRVCMTFPK